MKVLMIAHFMNDNMENTNNRFNYIADMLCNYKNVQLEVITSNFSHALKEKRHLQNNNLKYKFTMLEEPEYKKNVCIKRFYSHYVLGNNLKKYLKNMKDIPDVIYCAVPSLSVGKVAAQYAKKNNIRFIIDVQDIWPEAFEMVFKIPVINKMLFYPIKKQSKK